MTAWRLPTVELPPLHQQVLVELRDGPGQVCDVACYTGRDDAGDRWILADVRLDTRQIKRWAHIYPEPPADERKRCFVAGFVCVYEGWEENPTGLAEEAYKEFNR